MSRLRSIFISDVHLGNSIGTTGHIARNLGTVIIDSPAMAEIDIIAFSGDVFDKDIFLSDDETITILMSMRDIIKICKKWDIILLTLLGTPSHDRDQSKHFITLNQDIGADVRYINCLKIEHIEKFNINILFIPDEWNGENYQTQLEVIELLKRHNLQKVDYVIMHGHMDYQLPKSLHLPCHDSKFYLSVVNKYISIGHDHMWSMDDTGTILAQGSFDRLQHGEEGPKGYWYIDADNSLDKSTDQVIFKINENAAIFKTFDIIGLNKDQVETLLMENVLKHYYDDKNIPLFFRVKCHKNDPNEELVLSFKKSFPLIKWTTKIVSIKDNVQLISPVVYIPVPINTNTVLGLMQNRLTYSGIDQDKIIKALNILNEIKDNQ